MIRIVEDTAVMMQGMTGRQGSFHAKIMCELGVNLGEIQQNPAARGAELVDGIAQLITAIATQAAEQIARQAGRMHPDRHRGRPIEVANELRCPSQEY